MNNKSKGYHNKILVMDAETSGLSFNSVDPSFDDSCGKPYQSVSWGLIVANTHDFSVVDKLYVEIKWDGVSLWNEQAERVHGLTKQHLSEKGLTEEQAAIEIGGFILDHFGPGVVPCAGHNIATFDLWFMRRLLNKFDIMFKTGNRIVDTHSIGMVCYNTYTSDELFNLMGCVRERHNALEDAEASLSVLRNTRKIYNSLIQG